MRAGWDPVARFWVRVKILDQDDCWEWKGVRDGGTHKQYGRLTVDKKRWFAHRYAFYITYGYDCPDDVCHTCNNPPCCNPRHLYADTNAGNLRYMAECGRQSKGTDRHNAKLNEVKVKQIRDLAANGLPQRTIAQQFGMSQATVWAVINRKGWKHVS